MGNNQVSASGAAGTSSAGVELSGAGRATDHSFGNSSTEGISAASFGAGTKADGVSSVQLLQGVDRASSRESGLDLPFVELHDPSASPNNKIEMSNSGGTSGGTESGGSLKSNCESRDLQGTTPDAPLVAENSASSSSPSTIDSSNPAKTDPAESYVASFTPYSAESHISSVSSSPQPLEKSGHRDSSPEAPWVNSEGQAKPENHPRDSSPITARRMARGLQGSDRS